MKKIKSIVSGLVALLFVLPSYAQSYVNQGSGNTKISALLGNPGTMTSVKLWDLGSISGEDKYYVNFQAMEISDNKTSDITKGIKVTVYDDNKKSDAQLSSMFYFDKLVTYIDVDEYESIINSLNYMINTINVWGNEKMDFGDLKYRTKDNFVFGFTQEGKKQMGLMKIAFERVEFKADIKKLDNSLEDMRGFIETASKELYIDENLKKFEQTTKEEEALKKESEKAKKDKEKSKSNDKTPVDDEDQL
jgi:hypothetical protein